MLTILLPQKRMNDDKSNAIAIASRQMFVYDWYLFIVSAAVFFPYFDYNITIPIVIRSIAIGLIPKPIQSPSHGSMRLVQIIWIEQKKKSVLAISVWSRYVVMNTPSDSVFSRSSFSIRSKHVSALDHTQTRNTHTSSYSTRWNGMCFCSSWTRTRCNWTNLTCDSCYQCNMMNVNTDIPPDRR